MPPLHERCSECMHTPVTCMSHIPDYMYQSWTCQQSIIDKAKAAGGAWASTWSAIQQGRPLTSVGCIVHLHATSQTISRRCTVSHCVVVNHLWLLCACCSSCDTPTQDTNSVYLSEALWAMYQSSFWLTRRMHSIVALPFFGCANTTL